MNNENLFLRTLDDLSVRVNSNDGYEVLQAAALIRKLFLEANPLAIQVNRQHNIKLAFSVVDVKPPEIPGFPQPYFWSAIEELDPGFAPTTAKIVERNRDQFFSTIIGIANGHKYTVKDIVKFIAHVMGAVHPGEPQNDKDKALAALRDFSLFSNISIPLQHLRVISRIILNALKPLAYKVSNLERFESGSGAAFLSHIRFLPLEGEDNYIFDFGVDENKNRISLFISYKDELIFRLIDASGLRFDINVGRAGTAFNYGEFIYLDCELSSLSGEFLMFIDLGTWSYSRIYQANIDLSFFQKFFYVIGSNYNGSKPSSFDSRRQMVFDRMLNLKERKHYYENTLLQNDKQDFKYIEFRNSWMHTSDHPNFVKNS